VFIAQVGSLYREISKGCDRIFQEQGFPLDMDQIPVLFALFYSESGLSQQEISSGLQRDKASVNRTVALFARKEIAKIIPDVVDKRKTRVELTAAGKKLARQGHVILEGFNASLSSALSAEEKQQFHKLMVKLLGAVGSTSSSAD
jgi:DNA-binding MarR family transcriptional regulator